MAYIQKRKLSMHLKTMNKYYFWTGNIFMLIINESLKWPRKNSKRGYAFLSEMKILWNIHQPLHYSCEFTINGFKLDKM